MHSITVMAIDDDPMITTLLKRFLEPLGFQLGECHNAVKAEELLEKTLPDVVLVDLYLPEISGFELIERFHERWPALPLVAISGTDKIADVVRAMRIGAWNFSCGREHCHRFCKEGVSILASTICIYNRVCYNCGRTCTNCYC
jgi:DNA-binding NtrC family response regulator